MKKITSAFMGLLVAIVVFVIILQIDTFMLSLLSNPAFPITLNILIFILWRAFEVALPLALGEKTYKYFLKKTND